MRRFGFHAQPTFLVLSFSGPLDPARAQNLGNYTLVGPVSGSRSSGGHVIKINSAVYDPTTYTVTLSPAERLNVHRRDRLVVHGTGPTGMSGSLGVLLDGTNTGIPGSDFVANFGREILAGPASAVTSLAKRQETLASNAGLARAVDIRLSSRAIPVHRA